MGVVDGEEKRGLLWAGGLQTVGFDGRHVDEGEVVLVCDLLHDGVEVGLALDALHSVGVRLPDVADGHGEKHWRRALGLGVGNVLAVVPAVGVDGFGLAGEDAGGLRDVFGLVGVSGEIAARLAAAQVASIVMPPLQHDVVAGLYLCQVTIPQALDHVGAAASPGARAVGDVDLCGVKVLGKVVAPSQVCSVARGGVANNEERRQPGVERLVLRGVDLWRSDGRGRSYGGRLRMDKYGRRKSENDRRNETRKERRADGF